MRLTESDAAVSGADRPHRSAGSWISSSWQLGPEISNVDWMPETNNRGLVFEASLVKQYEKEMILSCFPSKSAVHN